MQTKIINLKSVPDGKEVSIKISSLFYQRLNKLMLEYADLEGTDGLLKALFAIKHSKTQNNEYAYNVETLLMLLKTVENQFESDGLIEDNEIEVDVPNDEDLPKDPYSQEDPQP